MYLYEVGRWLATGHMIARGARMIALPQDSDDDDDGNPAAGFSAGNVDAREAELLAEFERRRAATSERPEGTP